MTGAATSGLTRRGMFAGGLGLATGALLSACSQSMNPTSTGGGNFELVVGVNLELTGTGSTMGKLQEQALYVGRDEINTLGVPYGDGRLKVRLEVRDNGGSAATAGLMVQDLIDKANVSAIVGGTTVETAKAMLAIAETRKVPLLVLNSGDEIATPLAERKFVYQLGPTASDIASKLSRELRRQGRQRVAVLTSGDAVGRAGRNALPRALNAADRTLVGSPVKLPKTGRAYGAAAATVTASSPDAIIIWAQAPVSAAAVAAVRDTGYNGVIILDPGAGADETLEGPNANAVEDAYIVHPSVLGGAPLMATTPSARAARTFIYRYIQRYGTYSGFAPYSADALTLLTTAARRAVSVDPLRIRGRLEAGALEGVVGSYDFMPISHSGLESDALAVFQARNQTWVRIT